MSTSGISLDKNSNPRGTARQQGSAARSNQTVIAAGCKIVGQIELEGSLEIHGSLEGELRSDDEVIISESAVINANVVARIARVYGRVDGSISCQELIELKAGSCVTGNVISPRVVMEDGVVFEGTCSMSAIAAKKAATVETADDSVQQLRQANT